MAVTLFCYGAAFWSSATPATAADQSVVHLACNEFPPQKMEASPDGLPGLDVEIFTQAFSRVGIAVHVEYLPWKRALDFTKSGRVDGLCSCSRRADRDDWITYSDPIGEVGVGVFLSQNYKGPPIQKIADLRGLDVAVVRSYNLQQELSEQNIEPRLISDDAKGIQMLMNDRLDAFVTFRDTGKYILSKAAQPFAYQYIEFRASPYFLCLGKAVSGSADKITKFNRGLADIKADGSYERILDKYR